MYFKDDISRMTNAIRDVLLHYESIVVGTHLMVESEVLEVVRKISKQSKIYLPSGSDNCYKQNKRTDSSGVKGTLVGITRETLSEEIFEQRYEYQSWRVRTVKVWGKCSNQGNSNWEDPGVKKKWLWGEKELRIFKKG